MLDADDAFYPGVLERLVEAIAPEGVALAFGQSHHFGPAGWIRQWQPAPWPTGRIEPGVIGDIWLATGRHHVTLSATMWKAVYLHAAGGWAALRGMQDVSLVMATTEEHAAAYIDIPVLRSRVLICTFQQMSTGPPPAGLGLVLGHDPGIDQLSPLDVHLAIAECHFHECRGFSVAYRSPVLTIVGLAGGVGAALIGAWAALHARRPLKSRVELVDVSLSPPDPGKVTRDDIPCLDIKVRNTGGQPAVLKRLVVHTDRVAQFHSMWMQRPYDTPFPRRWDFPDVRGVLDVSETYDVGLSTPEKAPGERTTIDISQVVASGEADRFLIRLGRSSVDDTVAVAYLLHLELLYDANDRKVTAPSLAVVFPQHDLIEPVNLIRRGIHRFQEEVDDIRQAIEREMAARGRPAPNWIATPPRHRDELPGNLLSIDGSGDPRSSGRDGVYVVNENFWDPQRAIERHLHTVEKRCRELLDIITTTTVVHDALRTALPTVQETLAQLPALRAEFCTPEEAVTARASAPHGDSAAIDQLARLLAEQGNLEDLRARADNGDKEAAHQLHAATRLTEWLDDRLRVNGPDHPDTLDARENLAYWQADAGDMNSAAAAFAELVTDRLRVQGPDDPATLLTRHQQASCRGQAGDAAGAAAAFAELVTDRLRVQGPDDPATLDARHQQASCRGEAGDAAGAAAAFAELLPDRLRVNGSDHPRTLLTRHNLARWRGVAGDVAGAAAAFAELLPDRLRVLGPDHPDTLTTQRALAYWQNQANPDS